MNAHISGAPGSGGGFRGVICHWDLLGLSLKFRGSMAHLMGVVCVMIVAGRAAQSG